MNVRMSDTDEVSSSQDGIAAAESGAGIIVGISASPGPGPIVMAADTLEGNRVLNLEDDYLGKIRDIMIDVPTGRVAYAVLSTGGVLGVGDRLHAIPWSALILDADRHCFLLNADKERLSNAPGFDKEAWPTMADQAWASAVHEYYSARPYW